MVFWCLNPKTFRFKVISDSKGQPRGRSSAMASLHGHHAVVTGGGRGIGRAVAAALTEAGAAVTVLGRNESTLADAAAKGHAAGYVVADVTDARAVAAGVERAAASRGPIAILVANAGGAESAPFARPIPSFFAGCSTSM